MSTAGGAGAWEGLGEDFGRRVGEWLVESEWLVGGVVAEGWGGRNGALGGF